MNFKRFVQVMSVAAFVVMAMSCKKDDDDTTYESLTGTIEFEIPAFVQPGEVYTLTPTGISRDDGGDFGIIWVENLGSTRDTVKYEGAGSSADCSWTYTVPDSLTTTSITCYAYASGYYSSSTEISYTIVDPAFGRSVTGDGLSDKSLMTKDIRDGQKYPYATFGTQTWMLKNMAYAGCGGTPLQGADAANYIIGRYYNWNEAQSACPAGWHLPSNAEVLTLAKYLGCTADDEKAIFNGVAGDVMADAYFNGDKMWEYWPDVKITNKTGMALLPYGYGTGDDASDLTYNGVFDYACFWTSDSVSDDQGAYRYIYEKYPNIYYGAADKNDFYTAVRCIRD